MSSIDLKTMSKKLEQAHQQISYLTYKLKAQNLDKDDVQQLMESYDYILRNNFFLTNLFMPSLENNQPSINDNLSYLGSHVDFAHQTINVIYKKFQKLYPELLA